LHFLEVLDAPLALLGLEVLVEVAALENLGESEVNDL